MQVCALVKVSMACRSEVRMCEDTHCMHAICSLWPTPRAFNGPLRSPHKTVDCSDVSVLVCYINFQHTPHHGHTQGNQTILAHTKTLESCEMCSLGQHQAAVAPSAETS